MNDPKPTVHMILTRAEVERPERFWRRVNRTDTCWLWTGWVSSGYGTFTIGRKSVLAHRFAYELLRGPIPAGLTIDHLCRVPLCVNPDHMEPVTQRENTLRGTGFAAVNAAKTHCPKGHELAGHNVFVEKKGRSCRACRVEVNRRLRARRKESLA